MFDVLNEHEDGCPALIRILDIGSGDCDCGFEQQYQGLMVTLCSFLSVAEMRGIIDKTHIVVSNKMKVEVIKDCLEVVDEEFSKGICLSDHDDVVQVIEGCYKRAHSVTSRLNKMKWEAKRNKNE